MSRLVSKMIERRAFRPMAIAIALVWSLFIVGNAEAGLILPWEQEVSTSSSIFASRIDLNGAGAAAAEPVSPAAEDETPASDDLEKESWLALVAGFADSPSGASAPGNGSSGSLSFGSLVASRGIVPIPPITCEFRGWRERSIRLPLIPALELLDPPKTCV